MRVGLAGRWRIIGFTVLIIVISILVKPTSIAIEKVHMGAIFYGKGTFEIGRAHV
jgi:hypothetical protein